MFPLKSITKDAVALSLGLAVLWSLLSCASLCTLESTLHDSQASASGANADERVDRVEPVEDCCGCPDISSPVGTTQQRETGEQIVSLDSATLRFDFNIEPIPSFFYRADLPDESPPKSNGPPLFLRLRTFRI